MEPILIYITASSATEAETIARALLEDRLVACANILDGAESLYWWEGSINTARESVLICKSVQQKAGEIIAKVKAVHSYATPCVVTLPLTGGNPAFLAWIAAETGTPRKTTP